MAHRDRESKNRPVALVQSGYFLATGIWPLLHMRSFEWATGKKYDRWLVKTVGLLVAITGVSIAVASKRERISPETVTLAVGSAAALMAIDVVYTAKGRIRRIYLLDAVLEALLLAEWSRSRRGATSDEPLDRSALD
jgi:hypothetical protein